jgi:hypothetical protein
MYFLGLPIVIYLTGLNNYQKFHSSISYQKPITYSAYIYYIKNEWQLNLIYEKRKVNKLDKVG